MPLDAAFKMTQASHDQIAYRTCLGYSASTVYEIATECFDKDDSGDCPLLHVEVAPGLC